MQPMHLNKPFLLSAAVVIVAGIVLVATLPGLLGAMFTTNIGQEDTNEQMLAYLADHETDLETYQKRFEGRSFFFRPKPPAAPPPKRVAETIKETPEIKPTIPRLYSGPPVIAVLGSQVWFGRDNLKLRVGEEGSGVKVLSTSPPWTVKLAHAGGEYDVPIFKDYNTDFTSDGLQSLPTPGIVFTSTADRPVKTPAPAKRRSLDDG